MPAASEYDNIPREHMLCFALRVATPRTCVGTYVYTMLDCLVASCLVMKASVVVMLIELAFGDRVGGEGAATVSGPVLMRSQTKFEIIAVKKLPSESIDP